MAKKNTLEFDFDWDFLLVGIVSTARDYQLCWNLNRVLHLSLKKDKDVELNLKKKNKLAVFCHFTYQDEIEKCEFKLLGNKFAGEMLIPEYKMVDYFLMVTGGYSDNKKEEWMRLLKEMQLVTTTLDINPETLKSREHLIIE